MLRADHAHKADHACPADLICLAEDADPLAEDAIHRADDAVCLVGPEQSRQRKQAPTEVPKHVVQHGDPKEESSLSSHQAHAGCGGWMGWPCSALPPHEQDADDLCALDPEGPDRHALWGRDPLHALLQVLSKGPCETSYCHGNLGRRSAMFTALDQCTYGCKEDWKRKPYPPMSRRPQSTDACRDRGDAQGNVRYLFRNFWLYLNTLLQYWEEAAEGLSPFGGPACPDNALMLSSWPWLTISWDLGWRSTASRCVPWQIRSGMVGKPTAPRRESGCSVSMPRAETSRSTWGGTSVWHIPMRPMWSSWTSRNLGETFIISPFRRTTCFPGPVKPHWRYLM